MQPILAAQGWSQVLIQHQGSFWIAPEQVPLQTWSCRTLSSKGSETAPDSLLPPGWPLPFLSCWYLSSNTFSSVSSDGFLFVVLLYNVWIEVNLVLAWLWLQQLQKWYLKGKKGKGKEEEERAMKVIKDKYASLGSMNLHEAQASLSWIQRSTFLSPYLSF